MATVRTAIGQTALELDGRFAGWLRSLQPPGYRVQPVVAPIGPGGAARLAANVGITPMSAEFELNQAEPLLDWAQGLLSGEPRAAAGAALLLDGNRKLQRRIAWTEGLPTELRLPTLDAASKLPATLGLSWQPGAVAYPKVGGEAVPGAVATKKKAPLLGNFRVQGLPFDGRWVTRVALPTVSARVAADSLGSHALATSSLSGLDLGELRLDIAAAGRDEALAWVGRCIADGRIADSEYLGITVELLDATLKNVLFTVQLSGCGLLAYDEAALQAGAETPATVSLRLGVGQISLKGLG
jgi:hypothetical protein